MSVLLRRALAAVAFAAGGLAQAPVPVPTAPHEKPPSAPGRYTFVVLGDPQQMPWFEWATNGGEEERARVRAKIRALDPAFVVLAGDAVGEGFLLPLWKSFRKHYADLPIWPVLGNHDLHGPNGLALRSYFETFPHVRRRRWYVLERPPLALLMLDSNASQMSARQWRHQREWLVGQLERLQRDPAIRGVLLVFHHPAFSVHWGGGDERVRRDLWEPVRRYTKVMAAFSGHHHGYQHLRQDGRHLFVTGGGGSPVFLLPLEELPRGVALERSREAHHLLHAKVGPEGLEIAMLELQNDGSWREQDRALLPWPATPQDTPERGLPRAPDAPHGGR